MTGVPPSGEQFEIRHGDQRATIVEVGGGIRAYEVAGRPVLDSYPLDTMCDGAHGAPLIPWPNRLGDGRYRFDGVDYQVALTEPDKRNAIHGFLRWRPWRNVEQTQSRVVMTTCLYPLRGYPFVLDVQVAYELDHDGLTVATTATNLGEQPCPYGCGQHPYLSPGAGSIDDCTVHLDAATRILTSDNRQLPEGRQPVEGTPYDFRDGRRLGDLQLDFPFTDLSRDGQGRAWVRLTAPDGTSSELWFDEHYPIVELFTGDTLASHRRRRGLGTEPMSCPPNAFQTGDHVIRLAPGQSVTTTWGTRAVTP
jgi:aldose 1-epimerase